MCDRDQEKEEKGRDGMEEKLGKRQYMLTLRVATHDNPPCTEQIRGT